MPEPVFGQHWLEPSTWATALSGGRIDTRGTCHREALTLWVRGSGSKPWLSYLLAAWPWHSFSSPLKCTISSGLGHGAENNGIASCLTTIPERYTCVKMRQQAFIWCDDFWGCQFFCQEPAGGWALLYSSRTLPGTPEGTVAACRSEQVSLSHSPHVLSVRQDIGNRGKLQIKARVVLLL